MKYIEEFRNGLHAKALADNIRKIADKDRTYFLMEFCGGHTHAIHRYGIPDLLPDNVELIHGPGCPVCVLPVPRLDKALALCEHDDVILCTYADMMRVPGSQRMNLMQAKAQGRQVRMVYSVDDALEIAKANPNREVVFFAIGFETTAPATAIAVQKANQLGLNNFSIYCNHVLTPAAMSGLLGSGEVSLDGFIGPAHVSIVTGAKAYNQVAQDYQKPIVIAGFEPVDVMHAIQMLIELINQQKTQVQIQYTRAVSTEGNQRAQAALEDVFTIRERFEWRGLGEIPDSAFKIHPRYAHYDAEQRFTLKDTVGESHRQCLCGDVLRGLSKPKQCKLFATVCTPENPLGACMVSSEGACAAVYAYGRKRNV